MIRTRAHTYAHGIPDSKTYIHDQNNIHFKNLATQISIIVKQYKQEALTHKMNWKQKKKIYMSMRMYVYVCTRERVVSCKIQYHAYMRFFLNSGVYGFNSTIPEIIQGYSILFL